MLTCNIKTFNTMVELTKILASTNDTMDRKNIDIFEMNPGKFLIKTSKKNKYPHSTKTQEIKIKPENQ